MEDFEKGLEVLREDVDQLKGKIDQVHDTLQVMDNHFPTVAA